MPLEYLYRLLRRQIHWAEQESEKLKQEWELTMGERKAAWRQKEAILEDVILAEIRVHKPDFSPEDFAIDRGRNGDLSMGGDSTLTADASSRTGDTISDRGLSSSHRNAEMRPPRAIEKVED
jgi:hypothetical protein